MSDFMDLREPVALDLRAAGPLVLLAVAALGLSCVMTQLALMRELLGAFSGNEMVLGVVLGLWLLLMGCGTLLGRASEKVQRQVAALAVMQMLLALLPPLQVFLLRALRNVVFIRGAAVGLTGTVAAVFVLLLPYCLLAGFALTLGCAILARRDGPLGIGRAYVADSIGSIAGGLLFSFVLVGALDHIAILVFPALLNLLAAGALGLQARGPKVEGQPSLGAPASSPAPRPGAWARRLSHNPPWLPLLALALGASVVLIILLAHPDALSTSWQFPRQHVVARANSPYGRLIVLESAGQLDFVENGVPLLSTRDDQHVEETVHYPMAQRPDARNVLLVAGGISGTAKEILKYKNAGVDYVELDPLILELGRKYLSANLADSRIRIINTDGRLFVQRTTNKYQVAIIDVPAPATAQLNRFYTVEFLTQLKRVLDTNGAISFSFGQYENYVSPQLARLLASAHLSLKQCFQNVLVLPGSRVFFLASDGPLFADVAQRIDAEQIHTKLINRHYLDAMLTPDRMADIARATAQPAALNRDFSPILYYYHLRHWMSQFNVSFLGALASPPAGLSLRHWISQFSLSFALFQAALLILLGFYLIRLRGSAFVLFASGFAASALEVVLLLAFQVLCGSVYRQVGVIVTVFMVGLALGASLMNRSLVGSVGAGGEGRARCPHRAAAGTGAPDGAVGTPRPTRRLFAGAKGLALLAFAVAGYGVVLPLLLPLLNRLGGLAAPLWAVKALIALLALLLATLVGLQFPLANQLAFDGTITGLSRLYTADFVGAFLGALLACTLLIPLLGVTGVCLLTAALNLLAGAVCHRRAARVT